MTVYPHHDNEIYSFIDSYIILQISFMKNVIMKKKYFIPSWFNRNPCQYESGNYWLSSNTCHDPVRWAITWRWLNIRLRKFLDDMIADISKSYYLVGLYVPWIRHIYDDVSSQMTYQIEDFNVPKESFFTWYVVRIFTYVRRQFISSIERKYPRIWYRRNRLKWCRIIFDI